MTITIKNAHFTHHVTVQLVMSFENGVKRRMISIDLHAPHNNKINLIMHLPEAQKLMEGLIREIKEEHDNEHP